MPFDSCLLIIFFSLEGFFENDEYLGELAPVEVCYDADKPLPTLGGIRYLSLYHKFLFIHHHI